jgi:hypothetical protein
VTCHRLIDRYSAQMQRQRLAAKIAHAEKTAAHYATRDAGQSRLWVEGAEMARAKLDGLNADA